jgi:hypothetical protein
MKMYIGDYEGEMTVEHQMNNLENARKAREMTAWSDSEFEDLHIAARTSNTFAELNAAMLAKGHPERSAPAYKIQLRTLVHVWRDVHYSLFESIKAACDEQRLRHKAKKREQKKLALDKLTNKLRRNIEKEMRAEMRAKIAVVKERMEASAKPVTARQIPAVPARPMPARPMPARPMPARPMPARPMPARPMPARPMPARQITTAGDWMPISAAAKLSGYTDGGIGLTAKRGFIATRPTGTRALLYSIPSLRAYIAARNLTPGKPNFRAPSPSRYDALRLDATFVWVKSDVLAEVLGYDRIKNSDEYPTIQQRRNGERGHIEFYVPDILREAQKAGVEAVRDWQADGYVFGGPMSRQPRMDEPEHRPAEWYECGAPHASRDKTAAIRAAIVPKATKKATKKAPKAGGNEFIFDQKTNSVVSVLASKPSAPQKIAPQRLVTQKKIKTQARPKSKSSKTSEINTNDWVETSLRSGLITAAEAASMRAGGR